MSAGYDYSIVIPTYNRPSQLDACLGAISRMELNGDTLEVIVVDDGSERPLDSIIEPFNDRLDIRLIRQDNRGPAAARNLGASATRGEILAFTDDDCLPSTDWLTSLSLHLASRTDRVVGGRTINSLTANCCSIASQDLISFLYTYYNCERTNAKFLTSNNIAVARSTFENFGGFDPEFPGAAAEDRDFCDRWRSSGLRLAYAPDAIVYHQHHLNTLSFFRQHFGYGRGARRFHRARASRQQERMKIEPYDFYFGLLTYPLTRRHGWRAPFVAALIAFSQVANAAGFFWEKVVQKRTGPDF